MAINEQGLTILKECAADRSAVFFSGTGVDFVFQTRVLNVQHDHVVLANSVPPAHINKLLSSDKFVVQCQMTRFSSDRIDSDGEHIVFPLEALNVIEETRISPRFPFDPEERVVCELLNPFDQETRLSKTVMDMSAQGLSIRTTHHSRLFTPGTLFPDMRILIDGEPYTKTAGRVIYVRKLIDRQSRLRIQVGFQFDTDG